MKFLNKIKCFIGWHSYNRLTGTVAYLHIYTRHQCKKCPYHYTTENVGSAYWGYKDVPANNIPEWVKFK